MLFIRLRDFVARSSGSLRLPEETPILQLQRIMDCARLDMIHPGSEASIPSEAPPES
jgi:hypothetical protein